MIRWVVVLAVLAQPVQANAPADSLRPVARSVAISVAEVPAQAASTEVKKERKGLFSALRPKNRPKSVGQAKICGDPALDGKIVAPIQGTIRGCGVAAPVRLTSVSGVALSRPAIMDCTTAKALKKWIKTGAQPALSKRGGVKSLDVVAHYACRTRNNQKGAKISEHGKGRAIDIAGMTAGDGSQITLLKGWNSRRDGPALKKMWRAACGPFGTVLGPNSNRFHLDHFHFDTARYRSGPYCR
ncbi:extensin family protein [Algirhabdus cladophorae]|uniref:extensin-like domain-containing protein n=1 Tax=Algirhabdus cladophorae TaxID=3377108 RepID=UPI003B84668C